MKAAASRLARAATTRLKAYPGGGEEGGWSRVSWPTHCTSETKPSVLRRPEKEMLSGKRINDKVKVISMFMLLLRMCSCQGWLNREIV